MSNNLPCYRLQYLVYWRILGVLLLAVIALGSLAPLSFSLPGAPIPHFDKLVHSAAYGMVTAWYLVVFPSRFSTLIVPGVMLVIGALIEWLQGLTGYRDASIADAVANLSGIVLASWLITPLLRGMLLWIELRMSGVATGGSRYRTAGPQLRHRALWQMVGLHLVLALLITGFTPIELGAIPIPHIDKLLHFVTYGVLTAWFLLAFSQRKMWILTMLVMMLLSISVELMQGLTGFGGTPSLFDALADTLGILLACILVIVPLKQILLKFERLFFRSRRRRKHRVRRRTTKVMS